MDRNSKQFPLQMERNLCQEEMEISKMQGGKVTSAWFPSNLHYIIVKISTKKAKRPPLPYLFKHLEQQIILPQLQAHDNYCQNFTQYICGKVLWLWYIIAWCGTVWNSLVQFVNAPTYRYYWRGRRWTWWRVRKGRRRGGEGREGGWVGWLHCVLHCLQPQHMQ